MTMSETRRTIASGTAVANGVAVASGLKITDAKVFTCCPGRNFVTLKIYTDARAHWGQAADRWLSPAHPPSGSVSRCFGGCGSLVSESSM
jgi:hypothetical protein